jgi:hypothetical protein
MDNPEKLATRRGNQTWTIQRSWQHEGAIKHTDVRFVSILNLFVGEIIPYLHYLCLFVYSDVHHIVRCVFVLFVSNMDNPEKLATRRGKQTWTIQRNSQHEGANNNIKKQKPGNKIG